MKKCRRRERKMFTQYIADKAADYERMKVPASSIRSMRDQIMVSFEKRVAGEVRANYQTYVQNEAKKLRKSKLGMRNISTSPLAINQSSRAEQGRGVT